MMLPVASRSIPGFAVEGRECREDAKEIAVIGRDVEILDEVDNCPLSLVAEEVGGQGDLVVVDIHRMIDGIESRARHVERDRST